MTALVVEFTASNHVLLEPGEPSGYMHLVFHRLGAYFAQIIVRGVHHASC